MSNLQGQLDNNFSTSVEVPVQPGDFVLLKAKLNSPNIDKSIDIIPVLVSFVVFEDIFSNSLRAELTISDSFGLKEIVPIIGEETIEIEFYTKGINTLMTSDQKYEDVSITKTFRVYKISPIATPGEHFLTYTLHLCSPELIANNVTKVQKTFYGKTISDIARYIFTNYITKKIENNESYLVKDFNVEDTKFLYSFTMPNWSPFNCLNFLASRALSKIETVDIVDENQQKPKVVTKGAMYVFFESLSKFNFISLESKFDETPTRIINYGPSKVSKTDNEEISRSFLNIEHYRISHLFNINDNVKKGLYSSKLIAHDIIKMKYDEIEYNYIEKDGIETIVNGDREDRTINQTPTTNSKKITDVFRHIGNGKLCSNNLDVLGNPDSVVKLYPTSFNHNYDFSFNSKQAGGFKQQSIFPNNVEQWIQFRASQFQQLQNIKIDITINGDSSVKVGDIVIFNIPSFIVSDNREQELDIFLSGKFLISKIKHYITRYVYKMDIELIKDTFNISAPSYDTEKYGDVSVLNTISDELNKSTNPNLYNIVEKNFER